MRLAQLALCGLFWVVPTVAAQTVVTDIATGPAPVGSNPFSFHPLGSKTVFFTLDDSSRSLWVSDGTSAGSQLIHEWQQPFLLYPTTRLFDLGSELIFVTGDYVTGQELWKTDGTVLGTVQLKDIGQGAVPIPSVKGQLAPEGFLKLGSIAYFTAADPAGGAELWRTDGTAAGTFQVLDLEPGVDGSNPHDGVVHGGSLYFFAADGPDKQGLFQSDGTSSGTTLVRDFDWPIGGTTGPEPSPGGLTSLGSNFYFWAGEVATDYELWTSDGTAVGTSLFADLNPSGSSNPSGLTVIGGLLYFRADSGSKPGFSLFRTDGTQSGTIELYADAIGAMAQTGPGQMSFVAAGAGASNTELWSTDGTLAGTHFYMPGPGFWPTKLFAWPGFATFVTMNPSGTWSSWRPDGTGPGTHELVELEENTGASGLGAGGETWFGGATAIEGLEPWRTDGTAAGTQMVANLAPDLTSDSDPTGMVLAGDEAYFLARPNDQLELFVTDGSAQGTQSILPLAPSFSTTLEGAPLQGELVFTGSPTRELWKSDGTAAGTQLVLDVGAPGYPLEVMRDFHSAGDHVFFTTWIGQDRTPWVTDGTTAGTIELAQVAPGQRSAVLDSLYYFDGDDGVQGLEPWVSDGTAVGTKVLRDIESGPGGSNPKRFCQLGSKVFFTASTAQYGTEVWWTEGLGGATQMAFELAPGPDGDIRGLTVAGDKLFILTLAPGFPILPGNDHGQLWVSDGTQAGTSMIATFPTSKMPSGWASSPGLFAAGDLVYFYVGAGLWASDGTAADTVYLHEFLDWDGGSWPPDWGQRVPVGTGNTLAFFASEPATGAELWVTDGTVSGTLPITESLNPGPASTSPGSLARRGGQLLFSGNDPVLGRELFQVPIADLGGFVLETFGAGCANYFGKTPEMVVAGEPVLGGSLALAATGMPSLQPAFLLYSTATSPSPVDACTFLVEGPSSVLATTSSLYGKASIGFAIPTSPALVGVGLYAQWVAPFGATVVMSDAVEIQIGS